MTTTSKLTVGSQIVALAAFALLTSACEMKRDLTEMHDATVQMNKTTEEMNKKTQVLEGETGELYDGLRQGDSLQARRNALENLIKATDPARKLSEAGKYFMSFEVQLWSGHGPDTSLEKRNMLALSAAREFFKDVIQFIPGDDRTAQPLKGQILATSKSNMVNSLNALAATMHMLNPKQEIYLKEDSTLKPASMYAFIEEALLLKPKIESGEVKLDKVPEYVAEILANEKVAVYLLQARYNYIPALILGRTTNIASSKITAVKMFATTWALDLSQFNLAQMKELNLFVTGALQTRGLLKQLGQSAAMDGKIVRLYKNMKIVDSATTGAKSVISVEKASIEKELAKNLAMMTQF